MKYLIAAALILAALPAWAQMNWTTTQMGNGYQTYSGDNAQTGTLWNGTGTQMGNSFNQTFYGTGGRTLNCTTTPMGSTTTTSCY